MDGSSGDFLKKLGLRAHGVTWPVGNWSPL
jgi:hypothetical protein